MRRALFALLLAPLSAPCAEWPVSIDTAAGTRFALTGNAAFDTNRFDGSDGRFVDADGWRRTELGVSARRKDRFDAGAQYDFESRTWMDVFVRLHSKGLLGRDVGTVRAGWFKTPVGLDALGPTRAQAFLEVPLATQAVYQGRRTGVEWAMTRTSWAGSAAWFGGNDPEGVEQGRTWAARGAWTPRKRDGDVLHAGLAASRETPSSRTVRLRARPEAGMTDVRLVDTGTLAGVEHVDRAALEFIGVRGSWAMQAELMRATVARDAAPAVRAQGGHAWVGWVVSGESRPYSGQLGNVTPRGRGALELLARYSRLDLDDGTVRGGRQANWTVGMNYYLGTHFKVQLNYVDAQARRRGIDSDVDSLQLRAQVHF